MKLTKLRNKALSITTKTVFYLLKLLETIFTASAVVSLILAISVYGNDDTTIRFTLSFFCSVGFAFVSWFVADLMKDSMRRHGYAEEGGEEEEADRTFYNVELRK